MDLSSLGVHMQYGGKSWELSKSFYDFERLQACLAEYGYCDVPLLPDVDFSAGFDAFSEIHDAQESLTAFLRTLLRRPDTRANPDVLMFLDLYDRLDPIPRPVKAEYLGGTEAFNLAVSDVIVLEAQKLLIVSFEEKTVLCKIGRMWTMIEPDVIGGLKVYKYADDFTSFKIVHEQNFTCKIRCMAHDLKRGYLFLARDTGHVDRWQMELDPFDLIYLDSLALHAEAILSISITANYYYTSSHDDSIRKVDIEKNKVVGGGKLTRRLDGDKLMHSIILSDDVMLLGTSNNGLYTCWMGDEIPVHIDNITVPFPATVRKLSCTSKNIFVCHGNCVSCFTYTKAPVNRRNSTHTGACQVIELGGISKETESACPSLVAIPMKNRSAQFSVPESESVFSAYRVYDVAYLTKSRLLIVAYDESVAIWCLTTGRMLYCWTAHKGEQVYCLKMWDEVTLQTAGSDGSVKFWKLPSHEDLKLWLPT